VAELQPLQSRPSFTAAESKSATSKVGRRIIPFLGLLYMLSFLDRVNIGFAKAELQTSLGIDAAAYGLGAGIFFIGYILFEVPSNLLLHRIGARRWLARIMVTWGIVAAAMVFVHGPVSFYILRVILGIAEAGLYPGMVLYLTYWYSNRNRATAIGLSAYWGLPIAFIVGGPVSGLLLSMNGIGGIHGWQWMFGLEGLAASAVGVWLWFYLDDTPSEATWLSAAELAVIQADVGAEEATRVKHVSPLKSLGDRRVLLLGLTYFMINLSVYGLTFWLPSTVKNIKGLSNVDVGLISAIPWLFAVVSVYVISRAADRTGRHKQLSAICMAAAAVGLAISASVGPVAAIAALCLTAAGLLAALPTYWILPTSYLSGAAGAASIALINAMGNFSGFVAPYFLGLVQQATNSITIGLFVLALSAVVACVLLFAYKKPSLPASRQESNGRHQG
jgi:MFS family permease